MFDQDFQSIQENELEALQAIYGDDFTAEDGQNFSIGLSANMDDLKSLVSLKMIVYLPPTYPSKSPIISFEDLVVKLKELLETEAIFEIALFVEEFISTYNTLPLDTTHAPLNKRDAVEEKERKESDRLRKVEHEARKVAQEVALEISKKEADKTAAEDGKRVIWKVTSSSTAAESAGEGHGSFIGKSGLLSTFLPISYPFEFLIRTLDIWNPFYRSSTGVRKLNDFQRHFQSLAKFRHENVVSLISIHLEEIHGSKSFQRLTVVEEYHEFSLFDVLSKSGGIILEKARHDMKSLLVALGALHSRNIIHKAISARNIVYGAQHYLLNDNEPFDLRASRVKDKETSIPIGWKSPEEQTNEFFECDEQNDIWCLGRTFLEIIYGADLAQRSRTLDDFINKQRIIY